MNTSDNVVSSTSTSTGYVPNNNNNSNTNTKFKPYRNRPSKRQAALELLSFCILLAAIPAFLGGVIGIFVCFFGFVLGILGLFAWTRRHAVLFALLAFAVICLCAVNIVLRAVFVGQCLPYYRYSNQFNSNSTFTGNDDRTDDDDDNTFNNSVWCGNRWFVYIPNGIVALLAIPAFLIALSLLAQKRRMSDNEHIDRQNNKATTTTTTTKSRKFFN